MSADEVQAVTDSGLAPTPDLQSALVDIMVGHQLAGLQLGQELESVPAPGSSQIAAEPSQGPSPGTGDVPHLVRMCTLPPLQMPSHLPSLSNNSWI